MPWADAPLHAFRKLHDRGILVPVWAYIPNTPLQTGASPIEVTWVICFSRASGLVSTSAV